MPHEHYIISRPEVVTLISINRSRKKIELIYLISIYISKFQEDPLTLTAMQFD